MISLIQNLQGVLLANHFSPIKGDSLVSVQQNPNFPYFA